MRDPGSRSDEDCIPDRMCLSIRVDGMFQRGRNELASHKIPVTAGRFDRG